MSLTSANKIETNKFELTVAVDAETFKTGIDNAFRKNNKRITVPGFRKGKAPKSVVMRMYGEEAFYEDAINDLYPNAYAEAVKDAGIEPVDHPEVEILDVSGEGFSFKALVTVKPEVALGEYKGLKATRPAAAVTAEQVDEEIGKLQQRGSRVVSVTDRAAKEGDEVILDFAGSVDGVPFEGGKGEGFSLKLGSGQFVPGFEEQVAGKNIDEDFDVNIIFPEEYQATDLAGKAAVFACKIHEIKETQLPELDDEFAKDVSEFDTLSELKADLEAKLLEAAKKQAEDDVEKALMEQVVENMTVEVPQCMVDQQVEEMLREFDYRLQMQGMSLEAYQKYTGFDAEMFKKTYEPQALERVKSRLALEAIAKAEAIEPSDEDVDAEYAKMAESYGVELEKIKEFVPVEEVQADLRNTKALDLIHESAVVTEEKAKKPAKKATAKKKAEDAQPAEAAAGEEEA